MHVPQPVLTDGKFAIGWFCPKLSEGRAGVRPLGLIDETVVESNEFVDVGAMDVIGPLGYRGTFEPFGMFKRDLVGSYRGAEICRVSQESTELSQSCQRAVSGCGIAVGYWNEARKRTLNDPANVCVTESGVAVGTQSYHWNRNALEKGETAECNDAAIAGPRTFIAAVAFSIPELPHLIFLEADELIIYRHEAANGNYVLWQKLKLSEPLPA